MKNITIALCLLAFILSGCRNQKWCTDNFPCPEKTVKESIHDTVYIPHDSIITLPADNSSLFAWIYCDSLNNALIREIDSVKTGKPRITLDLHNNRLSVNCDIDSATVAIRWNERHTSDKFYETKTITITTNIVTRWQNFLIVCGWGFLITWAAILLILFIKQRKKLIP